MADINSPSDFADALLRDLGITPTPTNVNEIVGWEQAEGGNWANTAAYNPLNTTQPEAGSSPINSVGVQSYDAWDTGLQATIQTLEGDPRYSGIIQDLRDSADPSQFSADVGSSPWGTSGSTLSSIFGSPAGTPQATLTSAQKPSGSGSSPPSTAQVRVSQQTGSASILQYLDGFLNPKGQGGILGALNIVGDIQTALVLFIDRAIAGTLFLGITVVGIYYIIKGPAATGIEIAQRTQRISQASQRIQIARAAEVRRGAQL